MNVLILVYSLQYIINYKFEIFDLSCILFNAATTLPIPNVAYHNTCNYDVGWFSRIDMTTSFVGTIFRNPIVLFSYDGLNTRKDRMHIVAVAWAGSHDKSLPQSTPDASSASSHE